MKLAVRIQHTPSRKRWCGVLKRLLNHRYTQVITDDKGNLWEGAKKTMGSFGPKDTHILILQDDILPCEDFVQTVERIIELLPNECVTFFSNSDRILEAQKKGINWVTLKTFLMAQAYVMPTAMMTDFLNWTEAHVKPEIYFDDDRMAMYFFYHNKKVWATAPSLVEHIGWNGSTLTGYKPGHVFEPRLRMAKWFIGMENSGLEVNWANGLDRPVEDNEGNWGSWSHLFKP
jgi:hypothetical protein